MYTTVHSLLKRIFIRFEANKACRLYFVFHRSKSAIFTCKTNKNGSKYSLLSKYFTYFAYYFEAKLSEYFQKEPIINWGLRLWKAFLYNLKQIPSKNSLVCEYLQGYIGLNGNIFKLIFSGMWNWLKICQYSLQNEYLKQIFASMRKCICFASNWILVCEFVRIFWSEYENDANKWCLWIYQNMQIWSK